MRRCRRNTLQTGLHPKKKKSPNSHISGNVRKRFSIYRVSIQTDVSSLMIASALHSRSLTQMGFRLQSPFLINSVWNGHTLRVQAISVDTVGEEGVDGLFPFVDNFLVFCSSHL